MTKTYETCTISDIPRLRPNILPLIFFSFLFNTAYSLRSKKKGIVFLFVHIDNKKYSALEMGKNRRKNLKLSFGSTSGLVGCRT